MRRGEDEKRRKWKGKRKIIKNVKCRILNACHVKCDVGAYFTAVK